MIIVKYENYTFVYCIPEKQIYLHDQIYEDYLRYVKDKGFQWTQDSVEYTYTDNPFGVNHYTDEPDEYIELIRECLKNQDVKDQEIKLVYENIFENIIVEEKENG